MCRTPPFGNDESQWSLYAHVCFISTCNKKSQDHTKRPLQHAKQPLRVNMQNTVGLPRSSGTAKTHWDHADQGKPRLQDAKDCNIEL